MQIPSIMAASDDMRVVPFHLAIPVADLVRAREFYGIILGCGEGRSSEQWVDFDFFGHQLVCHASEPEVPTAGTQSRVEGHDVQVPHFGVVLAWDAWESLAQRLAAANCEFLIEPDVRFEGQVGEQGTFFIADPFGNVLEFKAMRDAEELFARGPDGDAKALR